jgi:uncharacterized membrane protein
MHWLLLVLISIVTGSTSNLYQKIAMREKESDPIVSSILFQILTGICYAAFAFSQGFQVPSLSLAPYFVISMVLYAAGTVCFFRAIKEIEASQMSIMYGFGSVITVIASFLFLGDTFTLAQLIGVACIVSSVVLINLQRKKIVFSRGMWLALLGTCMFGAALIADTFIIREFDAVSFIPIGVLGTVFVMLVWFHQRIPNVLASVSTINRNLVIYSILYASSSIAFYLAIENGGLVGQVSSIYRASIILTVILSAVFLQERKHMLQKVAGAVLTTIGVLLVSS